MKHLLFFSLLLFFAVTANSQPAAGKTFIGGDLGFSMETDKTGTTKNWTAYNIQVLPMVGRFISDKFAFGATLGINSLITKYPEYYYENLKTVDNTYGGGVFTRIYLISGTGGVFTEPSFTVGYVQNKITIGDQTTKGSAFSIYAGDVFGVYYYVTPKIAIEASYGWFGYSSVGTFDQNGDKHLTETLGFSFSPSTLSFGMTIML
jgi:hypothetical protein